MVSCLPRCAHTPSSDQPVVAVASGADAYATTRTALSRVPLGDISGARVLLKPNAGRMAAPMSGVDTRPEVVAAAIDALVEAGAHVSVGDSPIAGVRALEALAVSGIAEVARARGVPLIDLDQRPPVVVPIPHGKALQELKVCAEVLEHDQVISVPVMKTHMHTGVTLCIKNMKGCLWRKSKTQLHMLAPVEGSHERPLDIAIADMASVLLPDFAIIDGTIGLEGLGPSSGTPKPLGAVVVSRDPLAADLVSCRLMGIHPAEVPHLRLIAAACGRGLDTSELSVEPAQWLSLAQPFKLPPRELSIDFPGVQVLDRNSCSACQSTLLMFLKRYGDCLFDYFGAEQPVRVAIGKGHDSVPAPTLCLGNCMMAHKGVGPFVPGCPPVASSIKHVLTHDPKKGDAHDE